MTFLSPVWLLALPLIGLPILIHLLNRRRHRTIHWGAMQFLLSAKRMSRGMARLRQMLIMAARMLVIAGLILAVSRPLSSGWIGSLTGGKPETVIVLLDRSASMQQQQIATGETKLSSGLVKIVGALETIGGEVPMVLIENSSNDAISVDSPGALLELPDTSATESQSDIAALLQTALNYISDNQTGRTDVWICSDAAHGDWNPESSRWQSLNSGFSKLDGVRFHVLNFPERATENMSIVVDRFERVAANQQSELVLDLTVRRTSEDRSSISVPITFTINGLRSVLNLEVEGESASLTGHRIPIDAELTVGWGQVALPADANPSDNSYFFAFADPAVRHSVIVSGNETATRAIELAAATTIQNDLEFRAKSLRPDQVNEIDWQQTALLVWQAPLPSETVARQIISFVNSGRTVIFLPPDEPDDTVFAGASWGEWQKLNGPGEPIGYWNNDGDLLRKTRDGQPLPVNDLLIYRHCLLNGDMRVLAKLNSGSPLGSPLLTRLSSNSGAIYFLATWPVATHSSLDREGVTLFAMLHRAIAGGADSLGAARQFGAGSDPAQSVSSMPMLAPESETQPLAQSKPFRAGVYGVGRISNPSHLSPPQSEPIQAGVYGTPASLIALNRPSAEDNSSLMPNQELETLFAGLDFHVIDDQLGSGKSLASEIWKSFVVLMGIALLAEAVLCMPPKTTARTAIAVNPTKAAA